MDESERLLEIVGELNDRGFLFRLTVDLGLAADPPWCAHAEMFRRWHNQLRPSRQRKVEARGVTPLAAGEAVLAKLRDSGLMELVDQVRAGKHKEPRDLKAEAAACITTEAGENG